MICFHLSPLDGKYLIDLIKKYWLGKIYVNNMFYITAHTFALKNHTMYLLELSAILQYVSCESNGMIHVRYVHNRARCCLTVSLL